MAFPVPRRTLSLPGGFFRSIHPRNAASTITTTATIPAKNRNLSSMGHLRRVNGRSR